MAVLCSVRVCLVLEAGGFFIHVTAEGGSDDDDDAALDDGFRDRDEQWGFPRRVAGVFPRTTRERSPDATTDLTIDPTIDPTTDQSWSHRPSNRMWLSAVTSRLRAWNPLTEPPLLSQLERAIQRCSRP